ncbi:MAG TPA: DinB family protein [Gemmatimonadales bacterium]|nr:DinB family protein [Gemmatimonadales bacterium]
MDPRLIIPLDILRLNTRLYRNCLTGLSDEQAQKRANGRGETNSAAFIAAHLVDSRYYLLNLLGRKVPSPLKGCEGGFMRIDKVIGYPPLSEIQAAWTAVGELIERQLETMSPAALDAKFEDFPMPIPTVLGALSFMTQHECYHLGQLGLLRKHAGFEAMAYS